MNERLIKEIDKYRRKSNGSIPAKSIIPKDKDNNLINISNTIGNNNLKNKSVTINQNILKLNEKINKINKEKNLIEIKNNYIIKDIKTISNYLKENEIHKEENNLIIDKTSSINSLMDFEKNKNFSLLISLMRKSTKILNFLLNKIQD